MAQEEKKSAFLDTYNMSTFEQYIEFESFLVWICIFIDIKKTTCAASTEGQYEHH